MGCKIDLRNMIIDEADSQGVPPEIALAVATRETGMCHWRANGEVVLGDPTKYGRAIGVMQLLPKTAAAMGVDPYDVNDNIHGGVKYLRQLYDGFGDWALVVQHYNGSGPAAQSYATRVLAIARGYGYGLALQTSAKTAPTSAGSKSGIPQPPSAALPQISANTLIAGGIVAGAGLLAWAWVG